MALCKERYTWNQNDDDDDERKTKNEKKNSQKSSSWFFVWIGNYVYFYAQNALMQCILLFFSANSRSCIHTNSSAEMKEKKCFRVLSFVCTIEWMVISYENVGWEVKKRSWKIRKVLWLWVSRAYVENVCADYINLCNLQLLHIRELFFFLFFRNERR